MLLLTPEEGGEISLSTPQDSPDAFNGFLTCICQPCIGQERTA